MPDHGLSQKRTSDSKRNFFCKRYHKNLLMMGELYRKKGENRKAFECYNEALKYARNLMTKQQLRKSRK